MEALDNKCTVEQFNLLEIMLTGRAVNMVAEELFPRADDPPNPKATVVVAALEGDIHDIGKHIVKMVLIGNRYRVVDCGKDVPIEQVVTKVKNEQAQALCISGLITSVIPKVRSMKQALTDAGLDQVTVLAGGAALKQSNAESLQVDYVGETAFDAAAYLEAICGDTS
jgi:methanogenic corrinoid protein MtbC1